MTYRITPYNELTPDGNGSTGLAPANYTEEKDPCIQLYPSGLWRMPTVAKAEEIASADPISTQGWLQLNPERTPSSYFNMRFIPNTSGSL